MSGAKRRSTVRRFPVISQGAEYLVMGHLMRRNILAYKAPLNNEGYDLICTHPDPKKAKRTLRIQVKSRVATDSNLAFPVSKRTFGAFDYLVAVFMNVGWFYRKTKWRPVRAGARLPEFYTFPVKVIRNNLDVKSTWHKIRVGSFDAQEYRGETGFEQIADDLGVRYPSRRRKR